MWSDNETTQDLLGYQVHADLLKKIILNDDMLPISMQRTNISEAQQLQF